MTANNGESGKPNSLLNKSSLPSATTPTMMQVRIPVLPTIKLKGILLASHQPIASRALLTGESRRQSAEFLSAANGLRRFCSSKRLNIWATISFHPSEADERQLVILGGGDALGEGDEVAGRVLVADFAHAVEGGAFGLDDLGIFEGGEDGV